VYVDGNIGGSIDGTCGADFDVLNAQTGAAERIGFDGVWSTEVSRDPFLPLLVAAQKSSTLLLGTAVAVAFARNPMTMAAAANDLNSFSRGRFVLGLGSQIAYRATVQHALVGTGRADARIHPSVAGHLDELADRGQIGFPRGPITSTR
jgi:alkanesulfonate monooxygenase SsuD/methylene tetrahydromethanopterin reductase-like flavin-dependent oxidoreductase (luciferase family)